jgi:succinate dehydrogenase / fumarate reductase cytochrome b subunit
MQRALTLYQTGIGKKAVMAVSGAMLVGFLIAHLLGNLQVFLGPEVLNGYAASLRKIPALLWVARIGLIGAVVAHIWSAVQLIGQNSDARPVEYKVVTPNASTYASRTMRWSGPIVALFIGYHLAHLTFGVGYAAEHPYSHHNVYNNLVYSFRQPVLALVYIVANILVAMHLRHGVWSALQTLGANHRKYNALRERASMAIAGLILLGNVGIPLGILLGAIEPTDETFCYEELAKEPGECEGFEDGRAVGAGE